jgi:hypothetical protein
VSDLAPSGVVPAWHEALAYAFTGRRHDGLGRQRQPDLDRMVDLLGAVGDGGPSISEHAVPADLLTGISAAQFWAVTTELRRRLAVDDARPVLAERPLDLDERRLTQDRPPHH